MSEREQRVRFAEEIRERRGRGRPRLAVPIVPTSVKLPEPVYDALCRLAIRERQSVHAVMLAALSHLASRAR